MLIRVLLTNPPILLLDADHETLGSWRQSFPSLHRLNDFLVLVVAGESRDGNAFEVFDSLLDGENTLCRNGSSSLRHSSGTAYSVVRKYLTLGSVGFFKSAGKEARMRSDRWVGGGGPCDRLAVRDGVEG